MTARKFRALALNLPESVEAAHRGLLKNGDWLRRALSFLGNLTDRPVPVPLFQHADRGHPDFRVKNKVFASLGPEDDWGMVKLTPDEQAEFIHREPTIYYPAGGAWGRRGCTIIRLKPAKEVTVRLALAAAWRNTAPKSLLAKHEE